MPVSHDPRICLRADASARQEGPWRISKQSPVMAALPENYFTQKLGLSLLG